MVVLGLCVFLCVVLMGCFSWFAFCCFLLFVVVMFADGFFVGCLIFLF